MTHISARGFGVGPSMPTFTKAGLSPVPQYAQTALQQAHASGAAAAQACADPRFNTPQLQAACIETVQEPAASTLSPAQLLQLVQAKVTCHGFFDSIGLDAEPALVAQCITGPGTFLQQACSDPAMRALPACASAPGAVKNFVSTYKMPLIIGGGVVAALVVWKVFF